MNLAQHKLTRDLQGPGIDKFYWCHTPGKLLPDFFHKNNEGLQRKVFKKTKNRSCLIFHTLNYKYMDLKSGRISGLLV